MGDRAFPSDRRTCRFTSRAVGTAVFWMAGVVAGSVWGQSTCNPSPTSGGPLVLAELQVWHGLDSHSSAFCADWIPECRAYDSRDLGVIAGQIAAARAMGVDGFVVDWYGPSAPGLLNDADRAFVDEATRALFEVAETPEAGGFCVALLYDEGALAQSGLPTTEYMQQATSDLSYADGTFLSSPANLPLAGRPALFVFPYQEVDQELDWPSLRDALGTHEVTLLDQDPRPEDPDHDSGFDGFFAWVQPSAAGWDPFGREWGRDYLRWFYATMESPAYAGKVAVGGVWPGFDDLLAPWNQGQHRFMSRTEDVWAQTWGLATEREVEVVMIATWNDFEEGTDVEYGVEMLVDMENPMPEVLVRSSPVDVVWGPALGEGVVQVYHETVLIYEKGPQPPPVSIPFLEPGEAYEVKLWLARVSHRKSAAAPDTPQSAAVPWARSVRRTSSTPPSLVLRKRHSSRRLGRLATTPGEIPGLETEPLAKTVKIRARDPYPDHVFSDGFESGDPRRWSSQG